MAVLNILRYPDPRLHHIAEPVAEVDEHIRQLVRDMAETMYAAPGIGLAATQVDVHQRVVVIDVSEDRDDLRVFINPEIVAAQRRDRSCTRKAACRCPASTTRSSAATRVTVRALDEHGAAFELDADGLLAVCVQHEIDHLNGKVFVEYLSRLKQSASAAGSKARARRQLTARPRVGPAAASRLDRAQPAAHRFRRHAGVRRQRRSTRSSPPATRWRWCSPSPTGPPGAA